MPTEEDVFNQKQRLDINRRNLQTYIIQMDTIGRAYVTPAIINGIYEARDNIRRIKAILRSWGVEVEDMPDDDDNEKTLKLNENILRCKCLLCGREMQANYCYNCNSSTLETEEDFVGDRDSYLKSDSKEDYTDMNYHWPINYDLRLWQHEFLDKYIAEDKRDFLLVATPGAGKTIASLRIANYLLNAGIVKQIVVVCPTDHLRSQWLQDAAKVNIQLDKLQVGWSNNIALTTDFVGIVTTYQQVAKKQEQLRYYNSRANTLVILDEIHHCGENDKLTWGNAIKSAFENTSRRLLLSGTPFRTDNNRIPFADYIPDLDGGNTQICVPDYSYGYGDALKDDFVVRHVVFPGWDGKFVWENFFGDEKEASFETELNNKQELASRLRTAIHHEGQAIRKVIQLADKKLTYIRTDEGHTNAGGLIIVEDTEAAYELARVVRDISGEDPIVAVSDDENASENIDRFRRGVQKWIIAIKMVSEGVDIKRLRVGVYATVVTTRTFFRQVIGRVIRWDSTWNDHLEDQTAWFYVPEDPRLISLMKEIKEEIVDVIIEQERKNSGEREGRKGTRDANQMPLSNYLFKHSEGDERNHYFNGHSFPMDELQEAERFFAKMAPGFERIASAPKALFIRNLNEMYRGQTEGLPGSENISSLNDSSVSKYDRKNDLKSEVKKKVNTLVRICHQKRAVIPENPYQVIHTAWGRRKSYSHLSTNEQLEQKIEWLEGLIQRVIQGDRNILVELLNG
jgi:superfamily II DNA or RNA helicase